MAASNPTSCFKLVIGFGCDRGGWQEVYPIGSDSLSNIIPKAQFIFTSRLSILPHVMEVRFARIVNTLAVPSAAPDARRQEYKLDARLWDSVGLGNTGPVASWPQPGSWTNNNDTLLNSQAVVPNDDNDAVEARVFTPEGIWGTKFLHGIPDANKAADAITPGVSIPTAPVTILSNPTTTSWIVLLGEFMSVIRDKSVMLRKRKNSEGVMQLFQNSLSDIIERGVTTKKCGRPFDQQRGRKNPR
jgi:hypothetical protein